MNMTPPPTSPTPPYFPDLQPEPRKPLEAVHDGLAVASLVLSLLWLGGLGSLLAVIFGHVSRGAARRAGRRSSGLATAGLIIGYVGLAGLVLLIILLVAAAGSTPTSTQAYIDCVNSAIAAGTSAAGC